ncbi:MAG: hypothetical protein RLY58_17 [Pseudomonadota bacterium]
MLIRIPIALRIFVAVLLTVLIVGMTSLWVLDRTLRDGFGRYVAEVEMTRLDRLVTHLQQSYAVAGRWPSMTPIAKQTWLRREHFMLMRQERLLRLQTQKEALDLPQNDHLPDTPPPFPPDWDKPFRDADGKVLPAPNGSEHRPFMGPPISPDRLGLGDRLGLLSPQGVLIAGQRAPKRSPQRALHVKGQVVGYLTLIPQADPDDALAQTYSADQRRQILWVGLAGLIASMIAAGLLANHLTRPIRQLVETAGLLTRRRFDTRTPLQRRDELGDLAHAMNQLAQMLEQHERSRQQWVADTSHELRTPVAVLQAQIEALQDGIRKPTPEHLAAMQRHVKQLGRLIGDLNALSQADAGQLLCTPIAIDPWILIGRESESFADRLRQVGLSIRLPVQPRRIKVRVDPDRFKQVIDNLLENSARYTDAGGVIEIHDWIDGHDWLLAVDDTAPTVEPELLPRLGERFFRADASRSRLSGGSGLGLALSRQLLEAQGGSLTFSQSPLGGVRALIRLPLLNIHQHQEDEP